MDLFKIYIDQSGTLHFEIAWWIILLLVIGVVVLLLLQKRLRQWRRPYFEIDEAEIGIGNQKIKIRPNLEDLQIAFKFWAELSTRKIGIPIDEKNDVIVEIYNSWYQFFGITRELIKTIPVTKLRREESTKQIVDISVRLLNTEIRPHLTRWQAQFRRWWEQAINEPENMSLSPQDLQRKYPEYESLMADMMDVNRKLIAYTSTLRRMVYD